MGLFIESSEENVQRTNISTVALTGGGTKTNSSQECHQGIENIVHFILLDYRGNSLR